MIRYILALIILAAPVAASDLWGSVSVREKNEYIDRELGGGGTWSNDTLTVTAKATYESDQGIRYFDREASATYKRGWFGGGLLWVRSEEHAQYVLAGHAEVRRWGFGVGIEHAYNAKWLSNRATMARASYGYTGDRLRLSVTGASNVEDYRIGVDVSAVAWRLSDRTTLGPELHYADSNTSRRKLQSKVVIRYTW